MIILDLAHKFYGTNSAILFRDFIKGLLSITNYISNISKATRKVSKKDGKCDKTLFSLLAVLVQLGTSLMKHQSFSRCIQETSISPQNSI